MNNVDKINNIIEDQLGVKHDEVHLAALLADDLGADSLDTVEIVMELENVFEIEVPDDDFEEWKTVGDIHNYVNGVVK